MKTCINIIPRRKFLNRVSLALAGLFLFPRPSKAKTPTACGAVCSLIVVVVILGVVTYIVVNILKWCKKLDRRQPPADPESSALIPVRNNMPWGKVLLQLNDPSNWVSAWDISEAGYVDPSGNPYCVMFKFNVQSCRTMDEPWANACECVGYMSFTSLQAMEWSDTTGEYWRLANGSEQPLNLRLHWFLNGQLVANTYAPVVNRSASADVALGGTPDPQRFFRLCFPSQ